MYARKLSRVPEYLPPGEGQIFVPRSVTVVYGSEAQLREIKECTIVHSATTDATLIAYLPPTARTSAGLVQGAAVRRWHREQRRSLTLLHDWRQG